MISPRQPERTLADYLGMAIGPILIMILVGSLVFFLLEVAYRGESGGMIRWTLFWFVLGAVLVSRISIEDDSNKGAVYGVVLAAATGAMVGIQVDWVIGCWVLLGLAWWFAMKLTWDCTVLEDDEDSSGEGLLGASGLDDTSRGSSTLQPSRRGDLRLPTTTGPTPGASIPIPVRASTRPRSGPVGFGSGRAQGASNRSRIVGRESTKPPHSPGMWVIYFSLAALPLFGIGQHFIPEADAVRQNDTLAYVLAYVLAALGLLLTSSFLNLRKYLRRRGLGMPGSMAAGWIARGMALGCAMILLAVLLPRPQATYSLTSLLDSFEANQKTRHQTEDSTLPGVRKTSKRVGTGQGGHNLHGANGDRGDVESKRGGEESKATQDPGAPAKTQVELQGATEKISPSSGGLLKHLVYAVLALILAWQFLNHRRALWSALKEIWIGWVEFLRKLLHGDASKAAPSNGAISGGGRKFESLENPFRAGAAQHRSLEELARCTFVAAESCAEAFSLGRVPNQTPGEFLLGLADRWPEIADAAAPFSVVYSRVAYGGALNGSDSREALAVMEKLWHRLELRMRD